MNEWSLYRGENQLLSNCTFIHSVGENHAWYYKLIQLPVTGETMNPTRKSTTTSCPNQHISSKHSMYLCLYPQKSVSLSPQENSSFYNRQRLSHTQRKKTTHNWLKWKDNHLGDDHLQLQHKQQFLHQRLREHNGKWKKILRAWRSACLLWKSIFYISVHMKSHHYGCPNKSWTVTKAILVEILKWTR